MDREPAKKDLIFLVLSSFFSPDFDTFRSRGCVMTSVVMSLSSFGTPVHRFRPFLEAIEKEHGLEAELTTIG